MGRIKLRDENKVIWQIDTPGSNKAIKSGCWSSGKLTHTWKTPTTFKFQTKSSKGSRPNVLYTTLGLLTSHDPVLLILMNITSLSKLLFRNKGKFFEENIKRNYPCLTPRPCPLFEFRDFGWILVVWKRPTNFRVFWSFASVYCSSHNSAFQCFQQKTRRGMTLRCLFF